MTKEEELKDLDRQIELRRQELAAINAQEKGKTDRMAIAATVGLTAILVLAQGSQRKPRKKSLTERILGF